MEMSEVKKEIKDYVRDHYKYYGWYPYDVQVGDTLYTYEQYMDILSMTVQKLSTLSCIRMRIHYNKYIHKTSPLSLIGASIESMSMEIQTPLTK